LRFDVGQASGADAVDAVYRIHPAEWPDDEHFLGPHRTDVMMSCRASNPAELMSTWPG
jgi:hypothetical protein